MCKKTLSVIRHFTGTDPYSPHLWVPPAVKKALEIYKQWPYDLVVSSYGPLPHTSLVRYSRKSFGVLGG